MMMLGPALMMIVVCHMEKQGILLNLRIALRGPVAHVCGCGCGQGQEGGGVLLSGISGPLRGGGLLGGSGLPGLLVATNP